MTRLAIIFSLLFATPAWAATWEVTYEAYKDLQKRSPDLVELYISGLVAGSAAHQMRAKTKIYCVPDDEIDNSMFRTAIEKSYSFNPKEFAQMPISIMGIRGLQFIFPCKK